MTEVIKAKEAVTKDINKLHHYWYLVFAVEYTISKQYTGNWFMWILKSSVNMEAFDKFEL